MSLKPIRISQARMSLTAVVCESGATSITWPAPADRSTTSRSRSFGFFPGWCGRPDA